MIDLQLIEEELCKLAIDAPPNRKIAAEVLRDLVIQITRSAAIKDHRERANVQYDIMGSITKALALLFFLVSPKEENWRTMMKLMSNMTIQSAKDYMIDYNLRKQGASQYVKPH